MNSIGRALVSLTVLAAWIASCQGQESYRSANFTQTYSKWHAYKNDAGHIYYECVYTARNSAGQIVNQQHLWYFANPPEKGNSDWSHYWVYWYNPKKKAIWARCPTPHHPMYQQWQRQTGGNDLWQIIPEGKRLIGSVSVAKAAPLFEATVSSEKTGLPRVQKDAPDVITCVNFKNVVFN